MAQDTRAKKLAFLVELHRQAERALAALRDFGEMSSAYTGNGFAPGGTNPITQEDVDGSSVTHLSPAIIQAVIGAFNDLTGLAPGQYTNLRRAAVQPLGPPRGAHP